MADIPSAGSTSKNRAWCPTLKTAPTWAVQCRDCKKWRVIPTQKEYEEIRINIEEVRFTCTRTEGVSCNDPPDVEDGNGILWSFDKPNLPKSPPGFNRRLSLRNDLSRLEVYYETPTGKNLRRPSDLAPFFSKHPEYNHLSPADFNFKAPMIGKKHKR